MIKGLVGNTPLVKIKVKFNNKIKNIYAKLEFYNYTGSIKDRLAATVIAKSYQDGTLKKSMPIIEATSGNTGISFAAFGALYGHLVHIFMPDWASAERIKIMKMYGAKVHLVSKEEGGFQEAIRRADNLAKEIKGFRPNQFSNNLNILAHYEGTGKEIIEKVSSIDAFVSGFGTGGTLIGVARRIKEKFPNANIFALEPNTMTLLSENKRIGSHRIEGIGDDFLPDLVDTKIIDKTVTISDDDAINMAQILAKKLGLGVGISSGANFLASALVEGDNVVTIFPDDLKKYLSTDLAKENKIKNLISNEIEILSMDTL